MVLIRGMVKGRNENAHINACHTLHRWYLISIYTREYCYALDPYYQIQITLFTFFYCANVHIFQFFILLKYVPRTHHLYRIHTCSYFFFYYFTWPISSTTIGVYCVKKEKVWKIKRWQVWKFLEATLCFMIMEFY